LLHENPSLLWAWPGQGVIITGMPNETDSCVDIPRFETEHFFARHEFSTPWQLCNSDCESLSIGELLELAGVDPAELARVPLRYTETQGAPALRAAIAGSYETVQADEVVVLGSPVEGIYLAARTLLRPGDEIIVPAPAYDALHHLFAHVAGPGNLRYWHFRPTPGGWALDLDELDALLSPRTRLLVLNFPHNPTGFLPSPALQREILRRAEDHGLQLFCDEMYFGLVHAGTPPVPSAADLSHAPIVLSGLSKTHGLPGLRCGWLVVRDPELRERIMNWKFYTSICPPAPTEFLAAVALSVEHELRRRSLGRIATNLELAEAFFARWPARFEWRRPLAGSTALVGWAVPSVSTLSERLARDEGILVQSAKMLGGDDRHMRVGLGRDGFGAALERFENWLQRQA
jgi:aspartate/methionine/tyrosine aminotransferase